MPKPYKELTPKQYCELLESCAEGCENKYCFFKIFLLEQHPNPRIISQIKCFEKYKYEESERQKKDIGWNAAIEKWIEEGYAAAFAEVFDPELPIRQVYNETMAMVKKSKK